MRFNSWLVAGSAIFLMVGTAAPKPLFAQQTAPAQMASTALPDAPQAQNAPDQSSSSSQAQPAGAPTTQDDNASEQLKHKPPPQPRRILGIMPNYRAVSAGEIPPPPTSREAFKIATENSFDYSSFVFVGITSLLAEGTNSHPQLGKGVPGFWAYSWRGYLDKTDGNYWVDWIMPTVFHQDERYYAMGEGGIMRRSVYAATRILITPNYHSRNSFNASEILGRGISQAISLSYYPSQTQSLSGFSQKYAYALGRDALTNVFREVWPDINEHLHHHHE
jgi:hypothetical protein